jgi:hypothetical protein
MCVVLTRFDKGSGVWYRHRRTRLMGGDLEGTIALTMLLDGP